MRTIFAMAKPELSSDDVLYLDEKILVLNKPAGVICTNERRELRPRAIDLINDKRKGRIYTVGRLDEAMASHRAALNTRSNTRALR